MALLSSRALMLQTKKKNSESFTFDGCYCHSIVHLPKNDKSVSNRCASLLLQSIRSSTLDLFVPQANIHSTSSTYPVYVNSSHRTDFANTVISNLVFESYIWNVSSFLWYSWHVIWPWYFNCMSIYIIALSYYKSKSIFLFW